jgi:RimJ/RimL family protein N-acetyltransferase
MIDTERLVLRMPQPDDADSLLEYAGDAELTRWIGGQTLDREAMVARIHEWLWRWAENGVGHFVIEREGCVLGRVGFVVWDDRSWEQSTYAAAGAHAAAELGWTLARRHWGRGYATEAARAARAWGYTARGLERVISLINPDNTRSIRVAEKLGATPERTVETPGGPAVVWVHPGGARAVTKP